MSKEALMKFREEVVADEGLQQEVRELMFDGPNKRRAVNYLQENSVGFSLHEFFDCLENPGDDVELHELELDFVVGGQGSSAGSC